MTYSDVCYLIASDIGPRGVHDHSETTERMVYCQVKSVGRSEFYQANLAGMNPELTLKLADWTEYREEATLIFHKRTYRIIRTYLTNDGGIELTIQRGDING